MEPPDQPPYTALLSDSDYPAFAETAANMKGGLIASGQGMYLTDAAYQVLRFADNPETDPDPAAGDDADERDEEG